MRHINNKTRLVVLCVDLVGSTKLTLSLTPQELISIINIFLTERSMIISGYKGYVLKYKGDAVIGIFPVDFDSQKACINSIMCAKTMINIITQVFNLVFNNKLPLIESNVGIDLGDSMIILYCKKCRDSSYRHYWLRYKYCG